MRTTRLVLFLLACLVISPFTPAQVTGVNNSTSTPTAGVGHDYLKMLNETVDPANGSPSVRIGVPVPKGRGIMLPFYFGYDSNSVHVFLQNPSGSSYWSSDNTPSVSQGGWTYSAPYLSFDSYFKTERNGSVTMDCWFNKNFLFRDPSGGRHYLGMGWNETASNYCGVINQQYPQNNLTGGDQFFQSALQAGQTTIPNSTGSKGHDGIGTGVVAASVVGADGTVFHFTYPSDGSCNGNTYFAAPSPKRCVLFPDWIEDRNGNEIHINGSDFSSFSVADDLGRTSISTSGFQSSGNTVTVSGLSHSYTLTWGTAAYNYTISENVPSGDCGIPSTVSGSNPVITAITLPNGQQYQFTYDPTYGELSKITYPWGGYVSYTWGLNPQSASVSGSGCTAAIFDKPAILHRYVSFDGNTVALQQDFSYSTTWNPNWASNPWNAWTSKQTTVITTDMIRGTSFQTVYVYAPSLSGGSTVYYDSANEINLDPQVAVENTITYQDTNGATLRTATKGWFNSQEQACELQTLDNGQISGTFYTYGSGGVLTDKKEYDYGQITSATACSNSSTSPPSGVTPARETSTAYQSFAAIPNFPSSPSILDRPSSVITYGNGTRVAETDTSYDQSSVAAVSSPTEHDEGGTAQAQRHRVGTPPR